MRKNDPTYAIKSRGKYFVLLVLFVLLTAPKPLFAVDKAKQTNKTKTEKKIRPPRSSKEAMLLAIIPGFGQAYNHKYWKMPIVYLGFGVLGYFVQTNQQEYTKYGDAYTCKVTDPNCTNPISLKYSAPTLLTIRNYYRRNTQLSYIVMGVWYLLQMIDANVDAHMSHWNVSDKLSLDVTPMIAPAPDKPATLYKGLSLHFTF